MGRERVKITQEDINLARESGQFRPAESWTDREIARALRQQARDMFWSRSLLNGTTRGTKGNSVGSFAREVYRQN